MSGKKLGVSFLQGAIWLLFVLLMVEIGVRFTRPRSAILPDEVFNHVWRPSYSFAIDSCTNYINAQGWLNRFDATLDKPENGYRIFYLGDSFTAGSCQTTVARVVEAGLDPIFTSAERTLEVFNTGIQSYSPLVYELLLRKKIPAYAPNLVIINIDLTDLFDDHLYRQIAVFDSAGVIEALPRGAEFSRRYQRTKSGIVEASWLYRLLASVREYSHLADWIVLSWDLGIWNSASEHSSEGYKLQQFSWCQTPWSKEVQSEVAQFEQTLQRIIDLTKEQSIKLVLTVVPHLNSFRGSCSKDVFELVRSIAEKNSVAYLDSFEGISEKLQGQDPAQYYIPNDIHFNDSGYRLWGEVQLEFLSNPKNGLLDRAGTGGR